MKTISIDGHTFCPELLTGGWVIDAGCRGFNFSSYFLRNHENGVYALDIEDFSNVKVMGDNVYDWIKFKLKQAALTTITGQVQAHYFGNGTGNFLKGLNGIPGNTPDRPCETKTIPAITLNDIYAEIGKDIDILKLDIESSEYGILVDLEPIPRMITVEFHEHTTKELHDQYISRIVEHLCKHYHMNLYIREWPRYLFMDCLFIRKDLL